MSDSNSNPEKPVIVPSTPAGDAHLASVLPLRDIVVFPHMIVPLFVGREKSVRALEEVMNEEKQFLLLTQKNAAEDDPSADGLYRIGTLATVLQLLKLPDQTVRVLVEGKVRARWCGVARAWPRGQSTLSDPLFCRPRNEFLISLRSAAPILTGVKL